MRALVLLLLLVSRVEAASDCEANRCAECTWIPGEGCHCEPIFPAGTLCRAAASACDVAEVCDGENVACPLDAVAPADTECRPARDLCDLPERCDGQSKQCPASANQPRAAGTICRASNPAVPCDAVDICDGVGVACGDAFRSDGEVCDDGNACTATDRCAAGACVGTGGPITLAPNPLVFPDTPVGASSLEIFRITRGGASIITVVGLTVPGETMRVADAPQWPVALEVDPSVGATLAFTPSMPGSHTAVVLVATDQAACPTFSAIVRGIGVAETAPVDAGTTLDAGLPIDAGPPEPTPDAGAPPDAPSPVPDAGSQAELVPTSPLSCAVTPQTSDGAAWWLLFGALVALGRRWAR